MNDPCAPGYDPKTGLYQISFQWNPNGPDWGDIAWGTASSTGMIHWEIQETPLFSPDQTYDNKGVFTGCMINGPRDHLTIAYTLVSNLPIHHTLPHVKGSESLSLAESSDGGTTWTKIDANPILPNEPEVLDVTGWRDPFVARWTSMAEFLGRDDERTLFGIISGGIRDITPTTFLYAIDIADLTKWQYLGPLGNFGLNYKSSRWSGDCGRNWEVSNFMTLHDEEDPSLTRDFLVCGTEGCIPERRPSNSGSFGPSRPARGQLWLSGSLQRPTGTASYMGPVEMKYDFGGHLDHGCLYAANSFFDPRTQQQVVWSWITEEDLCDDLRHAQGWSGLLSMPRELRLMTMHHVVAASGSDLSSITSIEREEDGHGSYTIRTLASQPYEPLTQSLRQAPTVRRTDLKRAALRSGSDTVFTSDATRTKCWELDATFAVAPNAQNIGLSFDHSGDFSRSTTLFFDQPSEIFIINRPPFPILNSSELINSAPEVAPHTLFTTRHSVTRKETAERLHIRAWRDTSVLEVFVNGRTAISTRLHAAEETFGVKLFVDDVVGAANMSGQHSELISVTVWDGIGIK